MNCNSARQMGAHFQVAPVNLLNNVNNAHLNTFNIRHMFHAHFV